MTERHKRALRRAARARGADVSRLVRGILDEWLARQADDGAAGGAATLDQVGQAA